MVGEHGNALTRRLKALELRLIFVRKVHIPECMRRNPGKKLFVHDVHGKTEQFLFHRFRRIVAERKRKARKTPERRFTGASDRSRIQGRNPRIFALVRARKDAFDRKIAVQVRESELGTVRRRACERVEFKRKIARNLFQLMTVKALKRMRNTALFRRRSDNMDVCQFRKGCRQVHEKRTFKSVIVHKQNFWFRLSRHLTQKIENYKRFWSPFYYLCGRMSNSKMQTPPLPKGTRDFYPESMRIQNYIFDTWRKAALRFGYEEYEGPMFEHLELYTGKSGDEIVSQLYDFMDKGDRHIALRPEMTPTLARLVIQKGNSLRKPFKWFSLPRLFRYEKAQKGRLREFFQLNLDIIGTESIYAEADLLSAIASMLKDFGLKADDFCIGVSSRKLLNVFLAEIGVADTSKVYPVLDRRLKIGKDDFYAELAAAGLSAEQTKKLDDFMDSKGIDEVASKISSEESKAALDEIRHLFKTLEAAGVAESVALDLSIVRGLAYYTGIVFEVYDKGKSMRAIAGGGRYDSLTEKLGGQKVPGVGFGMGDVVLANLLEERGLLPSSKQSLDFFVASFANDMDKVFQVASELRNRGFNVNHPLAPAKLGKQMEQANAQGAKIVVYVDGDKAPAGGFEYKILTTGTPGAGSLEEIAQIKA